MVFLKKGQAVTADRKDLSANMIKNYGDALLRFPDKEVCPRHLHEPRDDPQLSISFKTLEEIDVCLFWFAQSHATLASFTDFLSAWGLGEAKVISYPKSAMRRFGSTSEGILLDFTVDETNVLDSLKYTGNAIFPPNSLSVSILLIEPGKPINVNTVLNLK